MKCCEVSPSITRCALCDEPLRFEFATGASATLGPQAKQFGNDGKINTTIFLERTEIAHA